jgi:hypothetical protein
LGIDETVKYMENSTDNTLQVYISFERLNSKDLAFFLNRVSEISDKLSDDYFLRFGSRLDWKDFPILEIDSIYTGNSIKISLIEGWKPKICSDKDNDIVIGVPKNIGIPLVIGWLLISGASQILDLRNKQLDNKLKEIEIQIKQSEVNKLFTADNNSDTSTISMTSLDKNIPELRAMTLDTIRTIAKNAEFTDFKINGISITHRTKE